MVTNVWRSRRLAGTTSTPPGQRSRSAARWLVELEARDEAEDVVRLLLLVQPVLVRVVLDRLLLRVIEVSGVRFLGRLDPCRGVECIVLLAARTGIEIEELVLRREIGEHAARDPAHVSTLVLRGAVLGVLLRDLAEVGAAVERGADVGDLLELGGERLEVAADRARGGNLDLRDVDLRSRRHDGLILPALGEFIAQELVTRVRLHVVDGEARGEPALHDLVLFRPSALLDLDDVVAEVRLDRIGDLADLESARGVLELLHELALPHPAELAARVRGAWIVRFVLRELVPERLAVRIQAQLIADRGRFRERVVHLERLVGRVLVGLDEDVAASELAQSSWYRASIASGAIVTPSALAWLSRIDRS